MIHRSGFESPRWQSASMHAHATAKLPLAKVTNSAWHLHALKKFALLVVGPKNEKVAGAWLN